MLAADNDQAFRPVFLRHDLMIELGRLESALENARETAPVDDTRRAASFEERRARISAVLERLGSPTFPRKRE